MKIVIRAGGLGTRLWPCSTSAHPKQFLPLFKGKSCTQIAYGRYLDSALVGEEDLYVSVGCDHASLIKQQLPRVDDAHLIVEPQRRDTGPAIGLETVWIDKRAPKSIIASLGSDHYCARPDAFIRALHAAEKFLTEQPSYIVAIACKPTRPETSYGHIKKGKILSICEDHPIYQVEEFTEKPNWIRAVTYTQSAQYLWNANFFVWRSDTILDLFRKYKPDTHRVLVDIRDAIGTDRQAQAVKELYPRLERIAIDYAIMEPAGRDGRITTISVDMGWSDIGSWATLTDAFPPDANRNLFLGGKVISLGAKDSTVYIANPGRKVVALVDVSGIAVVDTPEALLIVPKDRAARVKDVVTELSNSDDLKDLA